MSIVYFPQCLIWTEFIYTFSFSMLESTACPSVFQYNSGTGPSIYITDESIRLLVCYSVPASAAIIVGPQVSIFGATYFMSVIEHPYAACQTSGVFRTVRTIPQKVRTQCNQ